MMFISAFALAFLYSLTGFSTLIMRPLENKVEPATPQQIAEADGIIVLGGYTGDGLVAESRDQFTLGQAAERLVLGLSLHTKFPDKPLWFTGFSGALRPKGWSEAENTKSMLNALQISDQNIYFEARSRNTYENALYTLEAANPGPDETWLLITSAAHMPRSAGVFRAAGWPEMIYLPTDYRTTKTGFSSAFNPGAAYSVIGSAYHEYVGMLVYWMTDRWVAEP